MTLRKDAEFYRSLSGGSGVVVVLVEGGWCGGGRGFVNPHHTHVWVWTISRRSGAIVPFAGYARFGCITFEELVKFTISIKT